MSDRTFAATLAKGLDVLACFEERAGVQTMPEVVERSGFDRATVRRLCLTLEASGYLVREGRGFRLAPRVLALAGGYLADLDAGRRVQPVLREAAEALDMEVALATRDRMQAIYVDRAAPASARVTLGLSVGSTLPLLHTAVGRMLLARSAPDIVEAALARPPVRHTETSETDPATLRSAIETARDQGYCIARNEFEPGAAGVAVPVGSLGDRPFVLATTATVNRFDDPKALDEVLNALRHASMAVGRIGQRVEGDTASGRG